MTSLPSDIPEQFVCPISLQIMRGPVFCIHGEAAAEAKAVPPNTPIYDFDNIYNWLKQGGIYDPLTGIKYEEVITLRPNLELQRRIQEWCSANSVNYEPKVWPAKHNGQPETSDQPSERLGVWKVLKAVGQFLFTKQPHPFDAYLFAA